jgi:hypothetical protein
LNFDIFCWFYVVGVVALVVIFLLPSIYGNLKLDEPFCYHSFEEAEEWHANAKRKHPIRYFITEDVPTFFRRLNGRRRDLYYFVKNSLWDRYDIVRCRKLSVTWHDRDHRMLHACFQLLTDFIEQEKPWEYSATREELLEAYKDCDWAEDRLEEWQELRELYLWWQKREETGEKYDADQLMLTRLVKLRRLLWT